MRQKGSSTTFALRAGRDLAFKESDRTVRFEVPTVVDYEVIALT